MKNVSLLPLWIDGRKSFALLDPEGRRIPVFEAFAKTLVQNPLNTRAAYCRNLAKFFDYLFEATKHLVPSTSALTRDELIDVLVAYREYLVYGSKSGNQLAQRVNSTLPSPMVTAASCELMHAPLRRFIELTCSAFPSQ